MTLFIVLSGYCLMLPVISSGTLRGGIRGFYAGRAKRILPAYWAAMVFALILEATFLWNRHGTMFDLSNNPGWQGILCHALLINNLVPQPFALQVCSVFWSVALEWQIYFWFPVLLWGWKRIGPAMTTLLAGLTALMIFRLSNNCTVPHVDLVGINADYYFYFVLGMLAATLAHQSPYRRIAALPWTAVTLVGAVLYLGLTYAWHHNVVWCSDKGLDVYASFWFAAALLAASKEGGLNHLFSWKPLVSIGQYSYSVYLLHLPLMALLTYFVEQPLARRFPHSDLFYIVVLMLLTTPLVLFVSYHFALVFENRGRINRFIQFFTRK